MKGLLIFIGGAIVGAVLTFAVATGLGAGAGIVTGLQAGACLTVEAAREKGLMTAEQVSEVLADAGKLIASGDYAGDTSIGQTGLECEKVVAELKAIAAKMVTPWEA